LIKGQAPQPQPPAQAMTTAISPVAEIIICQLGGPGMLRAMLGTKTIAVDESSACFDFRMCRRFNRCKVTYSPGLDLYSVDFYLLNARKASCKLVESYSQVYADQLKGLFESTTGLRMSLR
jgi:hypothetical protein